MSPKISNAPSKRTKRFLCFQTWFQVGVKYFLFTFDIRTLVFLWTICLSNFFIKLFAWTWTDCKYICIHVAQSMQANSIHRRWCLSHIPFSKMSLFLKYRKVFEIKYIQFNKYLLGISLKHFRKISIERNILREWNKYKQNKYNCMRCKCN